LLFKITLSSFLVYIKPYKVNTMTVTLIQMMLIIACGVGWRVLKPAGLTAQQTRLVLTSVVYYLLLPTLILDVLWSATLGQHSIEFSLIGIAAISSSLLLIWCVLSLFKLKPPLIGALLLATAFPNVTYLGLPVLEQVFGPWARSVVIQLDLFAFSPLLFTVGILIARHYGEDKGHHRALWSFLNTPPFWAALIAVVLNLNQVPTPEWLNGTLNKLSAAVAPLMLFSLGLALSWNSLKLKNIPYIIPVIVIKLMIMPLLVIMVMPYLSMSADYKAAVVLDLAMPSMLMGIVFCDRYKLDSELYAMAVTVTTLCSLVSLPYWFNQI
jgi:predicted permease